MLHIREFLMYPSRVPRPLSVEVDEEYAKDFREACMVLDDSPKASAALSRRLLQHVIREKAGITRRDLDKEIGALIDTNTLPSDLANDLDTVRTVANFAAHPIKSTDTGAIVDVEPGEAGRAPRRARRTPRRLLCTARASREKTGGAERKAR